MNFILYFLLATCLSCHQGIEQISPNHNFSCVYCHNGDSVANRIETAHRGLIRNPSSLNYADEKCGKCHEETIKKVRLSPHSTAAGEINITRFLFGAQKSPKGFYSTIDAGKFVKIPEPPEHPESPAEIVDDLLRRKCLRCHINVEGLKAPGFYRASGCAACHVVYSDDGKYRGNDRAVKGKIGYPEFHRFTKIIPDKQCMHCHNGNRVGADYYGLFEHDYEKSYRSPAVYEINGRKVINRLVWGDSLPVYGIDFHHLVADIHERKGLWCIDCHREEVMEMGRKVRCESCHGGFSTSPSPEFIKKSNGSLIFRSVNGKTYRLKEFKPGHPGHDKNHRKVACSLCHAAWAYGDYGLHVVRMDIPNYYPWRKLVIQADPVVTRFLRKELAKPFKKWDKPVEKDFIDGKIKRGIWLSGWTTRRWEFVPMGVDGNGFYRAFRPMYQFYVSYVDSAGFVILDSEIPIRGDGKRWGSVPYTPHTTMEKGRACFKCHGSTEALGLGYRLEGGDSIGPVVDSLVIMPPAIPPARLFTQEEIRKLLRPISGIRPGILEKP